MELVHAGVPDSDNGPGLMVPGVELPLPKAAMLQETEYKCGESQSFSCTHLLSGGSSPIAVA